MEAQPLFDRTVTIEENFPKILRPLDEEVNMLDCKIDVNDKESEIEFEVCVAEHHRFYHNDHHHIYNKLMKHIMEMLEKGLIVDENGIELSKFSNEVKEYINSDEV